MAINPKIIKPRAAADLKPTDLRAQMLRDAQQDKLRKDADKLRETAKKQAADKKIRPAKDIQKGDARSKFLKDAKSGKVRAAKMPAADLKPGDMRSTFLDKAKSAASEAKAGTSAGSSAGSRVSSFAKGTAGRALGAAGFYFGDTFGKGDLNRGETEFMDMIRKKAGKGYGDKPVGPFKPAAKTTIAVRKEYPGSNTGNRAVRKAAGTYTKSYDVKEAPKAKSETPKEKSATVKTASDKSRLSPKMTSFERMKARQFEKEGYAGRSLTRAQAKKLAGVKTASNTSSLMSLFGISKKKTETPKATTKRTGPLKSAFAQISYQGRKK